MGFQKIAQDNLIYKCLVGSHLYGTETSDSDRDEKGVFIPTEQMVLGLKKCEQVEFKTNKSNSGKRNTKEDIDVEVYNLIKFFHLLAVNSPNNIELLFAPDKCILKRTKYWDEILDNKDAFLSLKVKHTFLGYAYTQRNKIVTKRQTYLNFLEIEKEKGEDQAKKETGFGERLEYYRKFGFDTKFSAHLIRLLFEGIEILREGKLYFPLHQNNFIRDIKLGKYSLEEVLGFADKHEAYMMDAYIKSPLPHTPDLGRIEKLQIKLLKEYWEEAERIGVKEC